jgi:hypothetical protein
MATVDVLYETVFKQILEDVILSLSLNPSRTFGAEHAIIFAMLWETSNQTTREYRTYRYPNAPESFQRVSRFARKKYYSRVPGKTHHRLILSLSKRKKSTRYPSYTDR